MSATMTRANRLRKAGQPVLKRVERFLHTLRELLGTVSVGLVLILVGVILLERYHASESMTAKLVGLFASELGFAFVIAAIIFAMIEEWSAREHCKTAIGHLYGVRPVGHFFKKIEDYVLKQQYYRGKVVVEYDFQEQIGEDILVKYSVEYDVTNVCTKDDLPGLSIAGGLSKKPLHTGATAWDSRLGVESVRIDDVELSKDELTIADDDDRRTQSYRVKQRRMLNFKESARIETSHFLVKHDHDATAWCASVPSLCAELRLKWSPGIRLKFAADAIHPESEKLREQKGANCLTVTLDEPFLIGHGFHFWWSPEPEPPALAAEPPS